MMGGAFRTCCLQVVWLLAGISVLQFVVQWKDKKCEHMLHTALLLRLERSMKKANPSDLRQSITVAEEAGIPARHSLLKEAKGQLKRNEAGKKSLNFDSDDDERDMEQELAEIRSRAWSKFAQNNPISRHSQSAGTTNTVRFAEQTGAPSSPEPPSGSSASGSTSIEREI